MSNSNDTIIPIIQASSIEFLSKNFIEDDYDGKSFEGRSYADFNELRSYPIGTDANDVANKVPDVDELSLVHEKDLKFKLYTDENIESNFVEIPSYLTSDNFHEVDFKYYPLDSNLEGFHCPIGSDLEVLSFIREESEYSEGEINGYPQMRNISQTDLSSMGITNYINEPVFTPEGLSTFSSDKNLFTSTEKSDNYGFKVESPLNTITLTNLADNKSLEDISYHQNYALSEECFAIDCRKYLDAGSVNVSLVSPEVYFGRSTSGSHNPHTFSFYAKLHEKSAVDELEIHTAPYSARGNIEAAGISLNRASSPKSLTKEWQRYYFTMENFQSESLVFKISFSTKATDSAVVLVSGLLIEESPFPTTYDSRKHSLNSDSLLSSKGKSFVAMLPLADDIFLKEGKWLLSYRRKVYSNSQKCFDSLGHDLSWGYREYLKEGTSEFVAEFMGQSVPVDPVNIAENFLDSWEQVFIRKTSTGIDYKVVSLSSGNSYSYTSSDTQITSNISTCCASFQLGGAGCLKADGLSGSTIEQYKGLYRDLLFIQLPEEDNISDSLISSIENSFFSIKSYSDKNNKEFVALYSGSISEV